MFFEVIGTGSNGNCYLLTVNKQTLIIEAGVIFSIVKKALKFDFSGVVGVLVTHEHGDHSKAVKDFQKFGKRIYCTPGTASALKITNNIELNYLKPQQIGLFKVTPFRVFHNLKDENGNEIKDRNSMFFVEEPCGFLIEFEGKRLVFITDSSDLKTGFENVDYWIIEANYSSEKLKNSGLDISLKKRIQDTHMCIDRCKTILDAHTAENSKHVLLIHGSEKHSNNEEFLTKIPYAAIATNGLIIDL